MFLGYNYRIMLKSLGISALMIATVGIAFAAQPKPFGTPKQGITKQGGTVQTQNPQTSGETSNAAQNVTVINGDQMTTPSHQSDAGNEDENVRIQRKLANLTAGLVFVGIAQALILILTICAIWGQTRANKNSDRGWILVHISVSGQPKEPLTGNLIKDRIVPGIVWEIQVAGNTPVRIIREEYRCRVVPADKSVSPPKPSLEPTPAYMPDPNFVEGQVVFAPMHRHGYLSPLESSGTPMSDQLALVAIGDSFFCAYGRVEYEDAFKRKATTQFCAIYHPGGGIQSPDGTTLNPSGFRIGGPPGYNYNT